MATYNDGLNHYNDDAARTAGEAITLDLGSTYTIRTDTRWHANSPASMTGTHGSLTPTEGTFICDGTDVRWLAITGGSGTSAIGTTVTQGGVSGYFLGYWASLTAAPSTTIGATGFIKFREVTGGTFSAGALTFGAGTGAATAGGADVAGWIEIVGDSGANIVVPRLGKWQTRGDWFYLDNTTGVVGQVIQTPTNNGGAGTRSPGIWIETAVSSGEYEFHPAIYPTTDGNWTTKDLGNALGETDMRTGVVKDIGGGAMQIGETLDTNCTYASATSSTGTYSTVAWVSTYTWASDKVTVYYSGTHLLKTGHQVHLDFTTGGATGSDGLYTITVLDLWTYTVDLAGSGASGDVTARVGTLITSAAHSLGVGDKVWCNFTTGGGAAGEYTVWAVLGSGTCYITYTPATTMTGAVTFDWYYRIFFPGPHYMWAGSRMYLNYTSGAGTDGLATALSPTTTIQAGGSASTYTWAANVVTITLASHGHAVGDAVYLDFTTGGATADGVYTVASVTSTSIYTVALAGSGTAGAVTVYAASLRINAHNSGSADSGNVTVQRVIGHVPVSGLRTRISNVIMREAATASRAANMVNATVASRPEFGFTTGGAYDAEYEYSTWYLTVQQAFSFITKHSAYLDRLYLEKIASYLTCEDGGVGTNLGVAMNNFYMTSNTEGGLIKDWKSIRGGSTITAHSANVTFCNDFVFDNVTFSNINRTRSSGYILYGYYDNYCTYTNCKFQNGYPVVASNTYLTVNNMDFCHCLTGYTNSMFASYGAYASANVNTVYDGMTFGLNGTIPNVGPLTYLTVASGCTNAVFKNFGTKANPLVPNSFRQNYYGCGGIYSLSGNNLNVKFQRIYLDQVKTIGIPQINSDKNFTYEHIYTGDYQTATFANQAQVIGTINANAKGCRVGYHSTAGQASIYGTHFNDYFYGTNWGGLVLNFNEPTGVTVGQYTAVAGTPKFNSAGGLLMAKVGDQVIIEDSVFRLGHTGFKNLAPTMSGGTIGNYTLEYDIDIGAGYSGSWTALTGANLSAITVNPAIGFKIKYRITTGTANTTAMTYLLVNTTSTATAQDNLYPLNYYDIGLTGLQSGTKVAFVATGTETLLQPVQTAVLGAVSYNFPDTLVGSGIDIIILKPGYQYLKVTNYILTATNVSLPISQQTDYGYDVAKTADVTFNGSTKLITVDTGITTIDVIGVYNEWLAWAMTGENLGYLQAFAEVGGNDIDPSAGTTIPVYAFLSNSWQIKPDEANHNLSVTGGVVLVSGGGDPFANTTGAYTVRINYQNPVNAIGVAASTTITPADVADAVWDSATTGHETAGTFGQKVSKKLATKNDLQI